MKKLVLCVLTQLVTLALPAQTKTINFDDFFTAKVLVNRPPVYPGYQGFNWTVTSNSVADSSLYFLEPSDPFADRAFLPAVVSSPNVAATPAGWRGLTVQKTAPGSFQFVSSYFTAIHSNVELRLEGYNGSTLADTAHLSLPKGVQKQIVLSWSGLTRVLIVAESSDASNNDIALDEFVVLDEGTIVPPPPPPPACTALAVTITPNTTNGVTTLTANASGGVAPYHYQWSTGDTTSTISFTGSGTAVHIEAENNSGSSAFQQLTSDIGGGYNMAYVDANDWMDYWVNVPASGTYQLNLRIATLNQDGHVQLRDVSGTTLAMLNVPNTGGWQSWQTISTKVTLQQGVQKLRLVNTSTPYHNWNLNWWELQPLNVVTPAPSTTIDFTVQAENYAAMNGVATEPTTDEGGGMDVGYIDPGDYMDYSITTPAAGNYTIGFRVATPGNNAQFQLLNQSGTVLTTINIPNTGGFQQWQTVTATVNLPKGIQTLRLVSTAPMWNNWNLNWLHFSIPASATTAVAEPPLHIEAENYGYAQNYWGVAMTEPTSDTGGGLNVGDINPGEGLYYGINLPSAGTYTVRLRIATPADHAQLLISKYPINSGGLLVNLPNTGGFQKWQTVSATVYLPAGKQSIGVVNYGAQWNNWNINWLEITPAPGSPASLWGKPFAPYTVRVTDTNGCTGTATWTADPGALPSIASKSFAPAKEAGVENNKEGLQVYPNPASSQFNVAVVPYSSPEAARLVIWDAMGRKVEERVMQHGGVIQLGAFYRPGVYYVELLQGAHRSTVKVTKLAQ